MNAAPPALLPRTLSSPVALLPMALLAGAGCSGPTAAALEESPLPTETRNAPAGAAPEAGIEPVWTSDEALTRACDEALATAAAIRDALKADLGRTTRTLEDTLEPMNRMLMALDTASGHASLQFAVHPEEPVRQAAQSCQERIARFENEVHLDRGLYEAVAAVDTKALDPLARRFAEHLLRDFRRAGVAEDEAVRTRLAAIHEEMVRLGQDFSKNIREDVRSLDVDPKELEGLPDDFLAAHPPGPDGRVHLTTDYPDFFPVETYARSADLRRRLYELFMARGHPVNEPLLRRLLELRHEYAKLLGHPTWASYNAEDKMVGSAAAIRTFLEEVTKISRPRMEADLQDLLERKRQDEPGAKQVEVWDRFYYVGKVREARYGFDAREVRPYLPYGRVRKGILDLYGELFDLRFVPAPSMPVWSDGVEPFEMWSGETLVGRFWLDMHPRDGKYKHAAMFPIQTGLEEGRIPMAALVCNFPDPRTGDGRALLEHSDVVTFFHEFGHLIHHLLARKGGWVTLTGINVEWDFVEAPSQILEEWAWDPDVLARFAHHADTGRPIPRELALRMRKAEDFGKGQDVMRQVFYAAYSFLLHDADPKGIDLERFTDRVYRDYSPYPRIAGDHVYANFGHLVGYTSMYYTYQWSLVISKDLFTRFEAKGLLDRDTALAYRRAILEPGGTRDARDLVREFLGRESSLEAYRRWLESE